MDQTTHIPASRPEKCKDFWTVGFCSNVRTDLGFKVKTSGGRLTKNNAKTVGEVRSTVHKGLVQTWGSSRLVFGPTHGRVYLHVLFCDFILLAFPLLFILFLWNRHLLQCVNLRQWLAAIAQKCIQFRDSSLFLQS